MEFYDFFQGLSDEERIKIQNVLERDLDEQNRLKDNAENLKRQIDLLFQKRHLLSSTFQINKLFELGVICSLCGVTLNNGANKETTATISNELMNKSSKENRQCGGDRTISVLCTKCGLKTCVQCLGDKVDDERILCKLCYMIRHYVTITGVWCSKWKDIRCENFEKSVKEVMHSEPNVSKTLLDKFQKASLRSSVSSINTGNELYRAVLSKKSGNLSQHQKALSLVNIGRDKSEDSDSYSSPSLIVPEMRDRKTSNRSLRIPSRPAATVSGPGWPSTRTKSFDNNLKRLGQRISVLETVDIVSQVSDDRLFDDKFHKSHRNRSCDERYKPKRSTVERLRNESLASSVVSSQDLDSSARSEVEDVTSQRTSIQSFGSGSTTTREKSNFGGDDCSSNHNSCTGSQSDTETQVSSVYSSDDPVAEILISIIYDYKSAILNVNVMECKNLYSENVRRNRLNPYVKLDLLPDANFNIKRKTKLRRRTFNPIFNEVFQFPGMTKSDVEQRTLLLSVWHVDGFGKKEFLGQCQIDLSDYPWNYGTIGVWYDLQDIKEGPIVNFGLKATTVDQSGHRREQASSTSVQLHFLIKSIQNVRSSKNVYATIAVNFPEPDVKRSLSHKTPCQPKDHAFVFQTNETLLAACTLIVSAWKDYKDQKCLGQAQLTMGKDNSSVETNIMEAVLKKYDHWMFTSLQLHQEQ